MDNIITNIAGRDTAIGHITEIWNKLPRSNISDTAAALGARFFIESRNFLSEISTVNELTKKLCCDADEHGISTYKAYKLEEALRTSDCLGSDLNLDKICDILYGIFSVEAENERELDELDKYASVLAGTCFDLLMDKPHNMEAVVCALLCLAGRNETDMYNYAYDVLVPALSGNTNWLDCTDIHANIALALELLSNAERSLGLITDVYDEVTEDPLLYKLLFIAAFSFFEYDEMLRRVSRQSDFDYDITKDPAFNVIKLPPEEDQDPLDDLDWDEFYSYQE